VLHPDFAAAVRDAIKRVFDGRETAPGDLPYPPAINEYVLAAAYPETDSRAVQYTPAGRSLARAARQVYIAGYFAGRACDGQIAGQVREAFGISQAEAGKIPHPTIGLAVCLVCDRAPDDPIHEK
jgi:hypothetical protein